MTPALQWDRTCAQLELDGVRIERDLSRVGDRRSFRVVVDNWPGRVGGRWIFAADTPRVAVRLARRMERARRHPMAAALSEAAFYTRGPIGVARFVCRSLRHAHMFDAQLVGVGHPMRMRVPTCMHCGRAMAYAGLVEASSSSSSGSRRMRTTSTELHDDELAQLELLATSLSLTRSQAIRYAVLCALKKAGAS